MSGLQWERLRPVRTALLILAGFAALCVAAFLFSAIVGFAAVGISLLVIEWLTQPERVPGRQQ